MLRLGVLASGRGSNFQAIIDEIEYGRLNASVQLLVVDNPSAFAIERAKKYDIKHIFLDPALYQSKDAYFEEMAEILLSHNVELIVLAGFMRVVRKPLIDKFPNRIMNIHPALLPSFKGLHGQRQAVDCGVKIAGCTVHFVDEGIDTGPIIIQAAVPIYPDDTEETASERILALEHKIYPEAIRLFEQGRLSVQGNKVIIKDLVRKPEFIINPPLQ